MFVSIVHDGPRECGASLFLIDELLLFPAIPDAARS